MSLWRSESFSLTFSPSFISGINPAFMADCPFQFFILLWRDLTRGLPLILCEFI